MMERKESVLKQAKSYFRNTKEHIYGPLFNTEGSKRPGHILVMVMNGPFIQFVKAYVHFVKSTALTS